VPTNTLLWGADFGYASSSVLSTRLLGPSGPVQLEQRYLPIYIYGEQKSHVPVLVPATELAPNTRYEIEVQDWRRSFVTASGAAEQTPALPELLSSVPVAGEGWRGRTLEFSHAGILIGDAGQLLGPVTSLSNLLLETPDSPDGGTGAPWDLPDAPAARWLTAESSLTVGGGGCTLWPDSSVERVQARFGAFDLAGNFSGWVDVPDLALATPDEAALIIAERQTQEEAERESERREGHFQKQRSADPLSCALPSPTPGPGNGAFAVLALVPLLISVVRRRLRRAD
jgi:hypothetical protein